MYKHIIAIGSLILLSSFVIFYRYASIPHNISFDEIEFAKLALSLDKIPYTVYSSLFTGHSTLYFYILLISFKILGVSNFALRFPSALFGIINILIFYFIMNKVFKNTFFAFLLSCVLLSMHWYINFSRFSFEATFLLFLELLSTFFLFKFLENKKIHNALFSGITAGLAFHSYYPGRIFFILPLFFLLFKQAKKYAFLFLLIFSLIVLPLLIYLTQHPDIRITQVSLFTNSKLTFGERVSLIGTNIKKTALMFNLKGDMNGRHNYPGKPALNPILGILFLGGLIIAIRNYSQFYNQYFLLYFFLSLILPIIGRTQDNPNMLRAFTAIPAVVYFIGKAYLRLWQLKTYVKKELVVGFIMILFIVSTFYEMRTYFVFQSRVFRNSFEVLCSLQEVIKYDTKKIPFACRVSRNLF